MIKNGQFSITIFFVWKDHGCLARMEFAFDPCQRLLISMTEITNLCPSKVVSKGCGIVWLSSLNNNNNETSSICSIFFQCFATI